MRVSEIYGIDPEEILSKGKQQKKVKASSLFCHWVVNELEVSLTKLALQIELSVPTIGYSVQKMVMIAKKNGIQLKWNRQFRNLTAYNSPHSPKGGDAIYSLRCLK